MVGLRNVWAENGNETNTAGVAAADFSHNARIDLHAPIWFARIAKQHFDKSVNTTNYTGKVKRLI